jgi:hypothetical protein
MKMFISLFLVFFSLNSMAVNRRYNCTEAMNINTSLPKSFYLEIENFFVSIQDDENDIYYKGIMTKEMAEGKYLAKGFKGLVKSKNGKLLINSGVLLGKLQSSVTIFDTALIPKFNKYHCESLD